MGLFMLSNVMRQTKQSPKQADIKVRAGKANEKKGRGDAHQCAPSFLRRKTLRQTE